MDFHRRTSEFYHPVRLKEAHWRGPSSSESQGSMADFEFREILADFEFREILMNKTHV